MKNIPRPNFGQIRRMGWLPTLIVLLLFGAGAVYAQTGGSYSLIWWTVDSGGSGGGDSNTRVIGGSYELMSTVGQPEGVSGLSGGAYSLQSGFWPGYISDSHIYLPTVLKRYPPAPDLVGNFTLTPPGPNFDLGSPVTVNVVVTNQGITPADGFWIDFFINPVTTPTVNTRWNDLCTMQPCYGLAWYVSTLEPGQSINLSSDNRAVDYSIWLGVLPGNTTNLHLYVDSWNPGNDTGSVNELNESNNLFTYPGGVTVNGQVTASEVITAPILPDRPLRLEP